MTGVASNATLGIIDMLVRIFKSKQFARLAIKAKIGDSELCDVFAQLLKGTSVENLGGNVYKKRLHKNLYRAIILTNAGEFWFFVHLYAKKDVANISDADLKDFKNAATVLSQLSTKDIETALKNDGFTELNCNDDKGKEIAP